VSSDVAITVSWDDSVEANMVLSKLVNTRGDPAACKYHCVYRQHMEGRDLDVPGNSSTNAEKLFCSVIT